MFDLIVVLLCHTYFIFPLQPKQEISVSIEKETNLIAHSGRILEIYFHYVQLDQLEKSCLNWNCRIVTCRVESIAKRILLLFFVEFVKIGDDPN